MPSKQSSIDAYLKGLPADRRETLEAVREVVLKNLPKGYAETVQYGMIGYGVPHGIYPAGYHCNPSEPVPFLSLANQKNHMALYMFCLYTDEGELARFVEEWKATGKKLDMGKSCVRFKTLEDVPLQVIGRAIKRIPVKKFIASYEAGLGERANRATYKKGSKKSSGTASKKAAKKANKKTTSKKATKKSATKKTSRKTT
ncbi:MAG: DUF1801 domain-containing protein [Planctomycetota bacterium]